MLKAKETFACVGNLPKKLITKERIEPLGSQRVGTKNKQPKVTWPMYLITLFGTEKCQFQHVLLHPKE